jgi:hypothetical protein
MTKYVYPTPSGYDITVVAESKEKADEIIGRILGKTVEQSPLVKTAKTQ